MSDALDAGRRHAHLLQLLDDVQAPPITDWFLQPMPNAGFLLQGQYLEVDREETNSDPVRQKTRKWYISQYATDTEVYDTVYALCMRSARHRVREHLTIAGERLYSPHMSTLGRSVALGMGEDSRADPAPWDRSVAER